MGWLRLIGAWVELVVRSARLKPCPDTNRVYAADLASTADSSPLKRIRNDKGEGAFIEAQRRSKAADRSVRPTLP